MRRGIAVWMLIMAAETLHGVLRGLFLVPQVGEAVAGRIGWPVGMALVLGITWASISWIGLHERVALFRLGAMWMALTFAFEIAIGMMRGLAHSEIRAGINPASGGLMLYSLAVMALAPFSMCWLRRRTAAKH